MKTITQLFCLSLLAAGVQANAVAANDIIVPLVAAQQLPAPTTASYSKGFNISLTSPSVILEDAVSQLYAPGNGTLIIRERATGDVVWTAPVQSNQNAQALILTKNGLKIVSDNSTIWSKSLGSPPFLPSQGAKLSLYGGNLSLKEYFFLSYSTKWSSNSQADIYDANLKSVVVTGLPQGIAVKGYSELPKRSPDGSFFQIVDAAAFASGNIQLVVPKAYIGDVDVAVMAYTGTSKNNLTATELARFTHTYQGETSHLLVAQSGSIVLNNATI
ncbi:MAG: hypothetical protein MJK04_27205, partial [Psychrosphaera sp.]|nr:hypothetical protein [Psychrosphaera sp.]